MPDYLTSLQSSFWVMVILQTIGSVDMPGRGPRKMPSPRSYGAIIVTWGVLQLVADMGRDRIASTIGWVIVLTGMVLGPFGKIVTTLFTSIANALAPTTPTQTG
jgi:hypothetical protein